MNDAPDTGAESAPAVLRRGRRKRVAVGVAASLALGAGYLFLLKPDGPSSPEPGEVLALSPIQLNIAGGRYLRIGLALQLTADAQDAEGSKALDAAIEKFTGLPLSELNDAVRRAELKDELEQELVELYEDEVMGVYFVDFVTQ